MQLHKFCIATLLSLFITSCTFATTPISTHRVEHPQPVQEQFQQGTASWYGPGFHGKKTSNREVYNQNSLTAAHNELPFGTIVLVTNKANGKSVEVRINDRGGFRRYGRIIDLSKGAAAKIDMVKAGTAKVEIRIVKMPS